ncbi:DegT/DnrJ/EryC1/StrS family aminotransferase [Echinicola marina]|uniref:aminotransferase class I/II-fold pyridoxal phosphate-dependent enzyme n=1 Tax=Echinicola marina TaxID=2859768 RepID=UPI001CF6E000|nr:aminotransferase class I/II-fold pyridoxal phosphate-dependent enzyme [Echinicola marina]UCS93518.1 DegT/DnrJ/EryC1/StrS family aminotransferase [Echinicola marina]
MDLIKLSEPEFEIENLEDFRTALLNKEVGYVGSYIDEFRSALGEILHAEHLGLFSSGTSSIHLALLTAGIKPGDEVICQSLTFAASANPICFLGASPVFVGSESSTWNMDPQFLERAIVDRQNKGKRVGAIIPVHLYGMPARIKEIMAIGKKYNVPIVEDAAEALGSYTSDGMCGAFGDFGILSFNANKIITTGGGGGLVTKNALDLKRAYFYALQAKDPAPHYEHSQLGYNYAFSNLNAVLGVQQLSCLVDKVKRRRDAYFHYYERLSSNDGITFQQGIEGDFSNRWLTSIVLPDSDMVQGLKRYLEGKKIETRPVWKPMHIQPLYENCAYYGDNYEVTLFEKGICLPSGSGLTKEQLEKTSGAILDFFRHG